MKTLDMKAVVELHKAKFGVEPKITGVNHFRSDEIIINIYESIEKGEPYIEDDVPDGIVI